MTKAGRELGIDDAAVREASQQGQLVEYLTKKLGGFAEAGAAASHTLNNEVVRLNNELGQLKQIATQDLLEPLTEGVARLNQFLGDSRMQQYAAGIGSIADAIAHIPKDTLEALYRFGAGLGLSSSAVTTGLANASTAVPLVGSAVSGYQQFTAMFGETFNAGAAREQQRQFQVRLENLQAEVEAAKTLTEQEKARQDVLTCYGRTSGDGLRSRSRCNCARSQPIRGARRPVY
jgi:hypothetical protein